MSEDLVVSIFDENNDIEEDNVLMGKVIILYFFILYSSSVCFNLHCCFSNVYFLFPLCSDLSIFSFRIALLFVTGRTTHFTLNIFAILHRSYAPPVRIMIQDRH